MGDECEFAKSESIRRQMLTPEACVAAHARKLGEHEEVGCHALLSASASCVTSPHR
jgi:predicted hydrolase (HD superfamily)